ncbi:DUF3597 family protein [Xanthobacteraceae bacterium Astr-EGSB]|uniref:DUF3597 family protein n=1 Tax=Astrobacterium formosum TaxID=3069710 RepID=UPI0027AFDAAD|nr:DUF3597 family protein [Xanthobacteraceae bacterium Astr-EGSB]
MLLKRLFDLVQDLLVPDIPAETLDARLDKLAAAAPVDLDEDSSVVDLLKAIGKESDFKSRARLAGLYGIEGYTGTAEQNIEMHRLLIADLKKRRIALPAAPGDD